MEMRTVNYWLSMVLNGVAFATTSAQSNQESVSYSRANECLKVVETFYSISDGKHLFRETYPLDKKYRATYLNTLDSNKAHAYSYLWPFSGSLSAYVALFGKSDDPLLKVHIDHVVLKGLEHYHDERQPKAYASYVNFAQPADRFYDDNIWLGIDFVDLYLHCGQNRYLKKALEIWKFVESGMDDQLGGGIYWCEQRKESKNTCSNAPAVVYLLKLFEATQDTSYLHKAKVLYQWIKTTLEDSSDGLYWDNINVSGSINKTKFPYNTGQMIQSGAMLYKITGEINYLTDAQRSAKSGYAYFFDEPANKVTYGTYRYLKKSDNWFIAIMLRGYIELYLQDANKIYIEAFKENLERAWNHMRDVNGLFSKNWTEEQDKGNKKWILDQFAMAEMYGRMVGL